MPDAYPVLTYDQLDGWAEDDHLAAFSTFRASCPAAGEAGLRPGMVPPRALLQACDAARQVEPASAREARLFFEAWFVPREISRQGFVTGYFEPEIEGSLAPTAAHPAPLLARPDDLITVSGADRPTGWDAAVLGARQGPAGLEPYPDRAAIEAGALGAKAVPLIFLDPVDLFMTHVQGSVRVRLPDGTSVRFAYAARNGRPYTSIGRLLAQRLGVPPSEMTADRLYGWLRANPDEGRALMRENASYIFFRRADELDPARGPLGGAAVQLTPLRSLAVDRSQWAYGLPVFVETHLPGSSGAPEPFARLMVAQDTGSAIVGPARGDIFFGSGAEAGLRAGLVRERARFVVLWPRRATE